MRAGMHAHHTALIRPAVMGLDHGESQINTSGHVIDNDWRDPQDPETHMTSAHNESQALGALAARLVANATKTVPQLSSITRVSCCIC